MSNYHEPFDMSQLEHEFELAMGHVHDDFPGGTLEQELESMLEGDEEEYEYDEDADYEYDENDAEYEYDEGESSMEFELDDYPVDSFAGRLFELSQREFENEYELEQEMDGILDDMHREFFLGGLLKKGVQFVKSNPVLKGLVNKGIGLAANALAPGIGGLAFQGLKTALGPLSEGLKQRGRSLLKKGVHALKGKASGVASGFMNRMGINPANSVQENMAGLKNLIGSVSKSFEFAAGNLHDEVDDPIAAERLATQSFEVGLNHGKDNWSGKKGSIARNTERGTRVIHLSEKPGEEIEKIVIVIRDKTR
ncbi:MAG: hypothetical protein JNJ90_18215 [Saprospiraceae bacterium]|jgi:hypothetical protein|nr:hypothetical protein [Saprospiraceae bacterium]